MFVFCWMAFYAKESPRLTGVFQLCFTFFEKSLLYPLRFFKGALILNT